MDFADNDVCDDNENNDNDDIDDDNANNAAVPRCPINAVLLGW